MGRPLNSPLWSKVPLLEEDYLECDGCGFLSPKPWSSQNFEFASRAQGTISKLSS